MVLLLRVVQLVQLVGVEVRRRVEVRRGSHHSPGAGAAVKVAHVVSWSAALATVVHLLLYVVLHPSAAAAVGAEMLRRPLEVIGGQGVRRGQARERRRGGRPAAPAAVLSVAPERPLQDGAVGRSRRTRPRVGRAWKLSRG